MEKFYSIVIVSLNAGKLMEKTINSILTQTCNDYEIIIKDGKSSDDTITYIPNNSKIKTFIENDTSIYNAMNQAIIKTTGKYIIFMNCGDIFSSKNVLANVKDLVLNKKYSMIYGDYKRDSIVHIQPEVLTSFYLFRTPLCHQTIFFSGNLLRNGYLYNEKYKILADYELELRLFYNEDFKVCHLPVCVCDYQGGGISEKNSVKQLKYKEFNSIRKNFFEKKKYYFYKARISITFPKLRAWIITSDRCPFFIKKTYQKFVNLLNKQ